MLRSLGLTLQRETDPRSEVAAAAVLVGGAFLFYLSPSPLIYLPALFLVAALSWVQLPLALALVVLFAPFAMLPKHLGSYEFAPSEIFLWVDVVLAYGWALTGALDPQAAWLRIRRSPFFWPALLFLAAGAVSTIHAADRHVALRAFREMIFDPLLFFVLLVGLQTRLRHWWASFGALLGAGLLLAIIALVQRISHQNLTVDAGSSFEKVRAVYGSPDNLGLFLDRVVPVWLGVLLLLKLTFRQRLLWGTLGALLFFTLLLTFSRGAWFAIGLAGLAMVATRRGVGRWIAVAALVLGLAVAAVAGPKVINALRTGHSNTVQKRVYIWQSAGKMLRDHPVFGIGPDNFLHYYAPRPAPRQYFQKFCSPGMGYLDARAGDEPCLSHPHDVFLDFWLSTGVGGLVALLWLQFVYWRTLGRLFAGLAERRRVLLIGGAGAMLAGLLHGLVDNSYFLPDLALLFWLLVGHVSWQAGAVGASDAVPSGRAEPSDRGLAAVRPPESAS